MLFATMLHSRMLSPQLMPPYLLFIIVAGSAFFVAFAPRDAIARAQGRRLDFFAAELAIFSLSFH